MTLFFRGLLSYHFCNMKFLSQFNWLGKLWAGERKAEKLQMLQQQHRLLLHGLEASAEVIDATLYTDKIGNLLPVKLWLKLKKSDGSHIYTHSHTLISLNNVPSKGQTMRIKYFPDNLSSILIL